MDWFIFWELVYIFSALLCAILYPFRHTYELHNDYMRGRGFYDRRPVKPMSEHLTYGHVFFGCTLAIIPIVNSFVLLGCLWDTIVMTGNNLDNKNVFKGRTRDPE